MINGKCRYVGMSKPAIECASARHTGRLSCAFTSIASRAGVPQGNGFTIGAMMPTRNTGTYQFRSAPCRHAVSARNGALRRTLDATVDTARVYRFRSRSIYIHSHAPSVIGAAAARRRPSQRRRSSPIRKQCVQHLFVSNCICMPSRSRTP